MTTSFEITKSVLSPPGDTIQEHIDFIGMSQAELAQRMGRPKEKINDVIKGREPITLATAFQLEKVLGIPAEFWLTREKNYRQQVYLLLERAQFEKEKKWLNNFPIDEMQKLGWIPDSKDRYSLVDSLLKYFSVASTEEWDRIYLGVESSVAFRISLAHTNNPHAIAAWLRQGEIQSKEMDLGEFDKKKFKSALSEIKKLTTQMPSHFTKPLQSICAEYGVAVVFTVNLKKGSVTASTHWFHNRPIIQLSGSFNTAKHFWLTFFHEAAHLILHGKKDIFLENVKGMPVDPLKENEANDFASKLFQTDIEPMQFPKTKLRTKEFNQELINVLRNSQRSSSKKVRQARAFHASSKK